MNILFIEDEKDLAHTAVTQLEMLGHQVYLAYNLSTAYEIVNQASNPIDYIITDHRLPDGMGIQFAIEMMQVRPKAKCAVVSGCLTDSDIDTLNEHGLLYRRKPLLYRKVVDELRRFYAKAAPEMSDPYEAPKSEAVIDNNKPEVAVEPAEKEKAPKRKLLGFLKRKKSKGD